MLENLIPALLDVTYCPKMQSCAISRKTSDTTLRKWQQAEFWTQFPPPPQMEAIILCNLKKNYWIKLEKITKNLILSPILACLAQVCPPLPPLPHVTSYLIFNFKENLWFKIQKMAKNLI